MANTTAGSNCKTDVVIPLLELRSFDDLHQQLQTTTTLLIENPASVDHDSSSHVADGYHQSLNQTLSATEMEEQPVSQALNEVNTENRSVIEPMTTSDGGIARRNDYDNCCCSQRFLHGLFLIGFIIFLMLGVSLTCVGFLNVDRNLPNAKLYRMLGILSLLFCIGCFIAACVVVSDCVTSALKYTGGEFEYDYEMLYPSFTESLASARNYILSSEASSFPQSNSLYSIPEMPSAMSASALNSLATSSSSQLLIQQRQHPIAFTQQHGRARQTPPPSGHMCPTCSCHSFGSATTTAGALSSSHSTAFDEQPTENQPSVAITDNVTSCSFECDDVPMGSMPKGRRLSTLSATSNQFLSAIVEETNQS